jgi:hypothetical protein
MVAPPAPLETRLACGIEAAKQQEQRERMKARDILTRRLDRYVRVPLVTPARGKCEISPTDGRRSAQKLDCSERGRQVGS